MWIQTHSPLTKHFVLLDHRISVILATALSVTEPLTYKYWNTKNESSLYLSYEVKSETYAFVRKWLTKQ